MTALAMSKSMRYGALSTYPKQRFYRHSCSYNPLSSPAQVSTQSP